MGISDSILVLPLNYHGLLFIEIFYSEGEHSG